jgi:hypothetical protein
MYDLLKGSPEFLKYKIFFAAEINIYMGFPPKPARQLEPVWLPVKYLPLTRPWAAMTWQKTDTDKLMAVIRLLLPK